jgi:hypothetical protein
VIDIPNSNEYMKNEMTRRYYNPAKAFKDIFSVFDKHFKQILPLLTKEEKIKMDEVESIYKQMIEKKVKRRG